MRRRTDMYPQRFVAPRAARPQGRNLELTDEAAILKRLTAVRATSLAYPVSPADVVRGAAASSAERSFAAALTAARNARRWVLDLVRSAPVPVRATRAIRVQPVPIEVRRVY